MTNYNTQYLRNKIRHELIPLLEREYNPALEDVLSRTAEIFTLEDNYFAELAAQLLDKYTIQPDVISVHLNREHPALVYYVIRLWLMNLLESQYAPDWEIVSKVYTLLNPSQSSGHIELSGDTFLVRFHDCLRFLKNFSKINDFEGIPLCTISESIEIAKVIPTVFQINGLSCQLQILESKPDRNDMKISGEGYFDADKISFPLDIRNRHEGDTFHPLGMPKPFKLKDFLINRKIPSILRERLIVFESDQKILWVSGVEIADHLKVTEKTKKILKITLKTQS